MIGVKIAKLAEDVPCVVVFRALAMSNIADREVLEYICNDFRDHEMMERFRPSLEEAAIIQSQDRALVFIANRAGPVTEGAAEAALKKYATDLLSRDFLPHMGVRSDSGMWCWCSRLSPPHVFTRMSSVSLVSFVSLIYIIRESLEQQHSNARLNIANTKFALRARTQVHVRTSHATCRSIFSVCSS